MRNGIVIEFDEFVGLGVVESKTGERFPFHCTQIADGSRAIAPGTFVTFEIVQRHKGPEAYRVAPEN